MSASESKSLPAIGFLTVVEDGQHGFFGGYLVLNAGGRPLEFHCTAPVRPNQAQTILYGPTLRPYLCGEQIGRSLVRHAEALPLLVCTDLPEVLELREHVSMPVALVGDMRGAGLTEAEDFVWFTLGGSRLVMGGKWSDDRDRLIASWPAETELDLTEPFERIRSAISEAQRMAA